MTTDQTATDDTTADVENTDTTTGNKGVEQPDTPDEKDDDRDPGREAAKYRRRLRDAEADRDTGRTRLEALRRQVVEDASGLAKPGAIWAAGVDVHALFGEDGRLDREKLTAAVTEAADQLGLSRAPRTPKPDPSQGRGDGKPQRDRWSAALDNR